MSQDTFTSEDMQAMIAIMQTSTDNAPNSAAKAFRQGILDTLKSGALPSGQELEGLATLVYLAGRQDLTMKLALIYDTQKAQEKQ